MILDPRTHGLLCALADPMIHSSLKQNEYIGEEDTCIAEKLEVDCYGPVLLLPMVTIGIPKSRAKVLAPNSQSQGELQYEGAWTEWQSENLTDQNSGV